MDLPDINQDDFGKEDSGSDKGEAVSRDFGRKRQNDIDLLMRSIRGDSSSSSSPEKMGRRVDDDYEQIKKILGDKSSVKDLFYNERDLEGADDYKGNDNVEFGDDNNLMDEDLISLKK
jgi:hypothetical protein